MNRDKFLDGELTEERKNRLSGILDALKQKPSDSLSADENLLVSLIGSVLDDALSGVGALISSVASRGYRPEDDDSFCDVVVFVAAVGSKSGMPDCSLFLGDCLVHGRFGLQEDVDKGSVFWNRAMEQGDPRGALRFADFYGSLTDFKKEEIVLRYCIRAVLIKKNAEAFYRVGDFYFDGRVVGKDRAMAEQLYRRSYDLAKEEGRDLIRARAALRLAEAKKEKHARIYDASLALDNSKEVLACYTEAESIIKDCKTISGLLLKPDLERCRKGIKETKGMIDRLEGEEPAKGKA